MKYLLLMFLLVGCSEKSSKSGTGISDTNGNGELRSYEDSKRGITCYQTTYYNLSCVKTEKSAKEQLEEAQYRDLLKQLYPDKGE